MFDWSLAVPLLINTIVVSIPEEAFLVILTLILMRRFDLLEFKKANILKILLVVIPIAFVSNILRGLVGFDMSFVSVVGFGGIFILVVLVYRLHKVSNILKAFLSVTISFIVGMAIQLLYVPFIIYGTSVTMEELNQVGTASFIVSIIDRVAHISILCFLFLKKRSFIKLNFFKVITRNKILARISAIITLLNLVFIYVMCMLIYYDKILLNLKASTQLIIIVAIIVFPVINLSFIFGVLNYSVNKYTFAKVYIHEESRVLRVLVQVLLKQRMYEKIDAELESFENEVKKII
jgi:hypothetical protein